VETGFDLAWLALWGILSSAWCLSASRELSATFDEPFYVRAGIESWRSGSNRELMKAGTMALPVDVQCLPIYLCEQIRGEPFDVERDFHTLLGYTRATNLVFWWLLLGYGMLLARRFGGPWAGRLAVMLLATEPNLLGHACLATTDIALAAMILVFAYHYERGRDGDWRQRWLLPSVLYGLAMSAKASALVFVPIVIVAFELPRWTRALHNRGGCATVWRATAAYRADAWKIFVVGMVVVFAYCGSDWQPHPKLSGNVPAVFPNAGEAFHYQFKHNVRGHGAYLLGEWHSRAVWYYFPVALSIKLTLPVLLLLGGLAVFRPRALGTSFGIAALLLLLFSLTCRVQIGVRLQFPLVAFLLLAVAVGLDRSIHAWEIWSRRLLVALLAAGCSLLGASVWPDGLRYGNELWGGSDAVHEHLSDSNADWGQGILDLDRWTADNQLPLAWVWYYGSDPAVAWNAGRCLPLHQVELFDIRSPDDVYRHVGGKLVAVSTSILHGDPAISATTAPAVEFFRRQEPNGRTRNYFIYDFRQ
jgi:hypothetical protein